MDCAFLQYLGARILERAASVHLLFAFEYVIQVRSEVPSRTHCQEHCKLQLAAGLTCSCLSGSAVCKPEIWPTYCASVLQCQSAPREKHYAKVNSNHLGLIPSSAGSCGCSGMWWRSKG